MNGKFSAKGAGSGAMLGYLTGFPAMYLISLLPLALNNAHRTPVQLWAEGDPIVVSALVHALAAAALGGIAGSVDTYRASFLLAVAGSLTYFALYVVPFQIMATAGAREWMSAPSSSDGNIGAAFVVGLALFGLCALLTAVMASGLGGVAINRRLNRKPENSCATV